MTYDFMKKPEGTCVKCNLRTATTWWAGEGGDLALIHGDIEPRCEQCCVEDQLEFARKVAARIPALETRLAELKQEAR